MKLPWATWGALVFTALPVLTKAAPPSEILKFTLEETPVQLIRILGQPVQVDDSGPAYRAWLYQIDSQDNHEFSHVLCFRNAGGPLISITRNFAEPQEVDSLLPVGHTSVYQWPTKGPAQFRVRVRDLSGDRLLIAMGVAKPGDKASQLLLIRRSALRFFLPWLDEQLKPADTTYSPVP